MQVPGIPPMPITSSATSLTIVLSVAATLGVPMTKTTPGKEALTTTINNQAKEEQELSVPETILPVVTTNNESQ